MKMVMNQTTLNFIFKKTPLSCFAGGHAAASPYG